MSNISPEVTAVVSPAELSGIIDNPQAIIDPAAYDNMRGIFEGMGANGLNLFDQLIFTLREALNTALTQIFFMFMIVALMAMVANFFLKGIPQYPDKTASPSDTQTKD